MDSMKSDMAGAAAVIGAVSTLGGAAVGALIDARYDGSIVPMGVAAVVVSVTALVCARWADAVWAREAERETITPEEQAEGTATAPVESSSSSARVTVRLSTRCRRG